MLESQITNILNNPSSSGKLNAMLFFRSPQIYFETIYKDLIEVFKPKEVVCSLLDLKTMEMENIEVSTFSTQSSNAIIRLIFTKENETIILEYYNYQFIIEHLFWANDLKIVNGYSVIEKYFEENINSILVIGYELSIDISSYESSLEDNISDISLHPIFVIKKNNGNLLKEEYISNNNLNEQKIEVMKKYLETIHVN